VATDGYLFDNQTKGRILLLPVEEKGKVKPAGRVVEDFSTESGTK